MKGEGMSTDNAVPETAVETVANGHEGAKGRIAVAALELFCEKGYETTSVREIVESAGVTKPVLYYYFKNKDDLFSTILNEILEDHLGRISKACEEAEDDLRAALEALEHIFIDRALHPAVYGTGVED